LADDYDRRLAASKPAGLARPPLLRARTRTACERRSRSTDRE
jgi:hypothetical protein